MSKSENKNHSNSTISLNTNTMPNDCVTREKNRIKKCHKEQHKCESLRKCFGFFDFLETSWKTFKEFSADTSIHGKAKLFQNEIRE